MQAGNEANTPDTGNTYSPVTVSLGCPFLVTTPYKLIHGHMVTCKLYDNYSVSLHVSTIILISSSARNVYHRITEKI